MSRSIPVFLILFSLILLTGCDPYAQNDYQEYYVVECYLVVNRGLPQVKVSRTLPVNQPYSFNEAALSDANVEIRQIDTTGIIKKTYAYHRTKPGIYHPNHPQRVLPQQQYQLLVSFSNGDSLTATTLVPGEFHPTGMIPDTAYYQSPKQIAVDITPSFYPGRQSYFIFTVNVIDPSPDRLTPFYADALDKNDENDISDYYINSSGIINEKNYDRNSDGTLTIKLPWIAVAFYGNNQVVANAIDENMYDFVRTQNVQTGGSTLPPGQIQNVKYHVKGGIGIFGSMASDTVSVFIRKQGSIE